MNAMEAQRELARLYSELDNSTGRLHLIHSQRLQCRRGCFACCVDGITVYEIEAINIRDHHKQLLETEAPHKSGACAFLDDFGSCRIYEHRPYVCRTQGLPLRWLEEVAYDNLVEMRDICPLNDEGEPIENLSEQVCWTIGPFEERLAIMQFAADGGEMKRVALRDLFTAQEPND